MVGISFSEKVISYGDLNVDTLQETLLFYFYDRGGRSLHSKI